jgi:hypothetical protein
MQPRALGRKVSDEFAVPLCRTHHRAAHCAGDERAWWEQVGIDPIKVARELWSKARLNDGSMPSLRMVRSGLDVWIRTLGFTSMVVKLYGEISQLIQ